LKNTSDDQVQSTSSPMTPLAIVGIGCMFPEAENTGKFWTNIKNGTDAITEVPETHWRADDYYNQDPKSPDKVYAKLGGFLSPVEFNPMDYGILPNAIEAIDTSQLLGLLAVEQALKDAGYSAERDFDRDKVSVIVGVTGTLELVIPLGARLGYPRWKEALKDAGIDDRLAEDAMQRISDSYVPWQENSFPGLLGNVVAGRISKHFDLGGTNCAVDAACGSSLSALNLAALELMAGHSDMVITGGIDTFNDIFMYTCFSKTPALSPTGHARPYDKESDGTTLGEGLGIVVIKRLADAERDGDKIYAVVKGIGASSDGKGAAIYEPDAGGQAKALRRAYEQAGVTPDTIELIEGHGTGTRVGDAIEVSALQEVFGAAEKPWCALGSIKSQIGHTKAAAGVAGLIKASLSLHNKILPATIKVKQPHDSLVSATSPFYVNTETRPWLAHPDHPRRAGISALGFGGSNFHCLLEEYNTEKTEVDWDGDVQILPFSAADKSLLTKELSEFTASSDWNQLRLLAHEKRQQYDSAANQRIVLVIENGQTDISQSIKNALKLIGTSQEQAFQELPGGVFYASGSTKSPLGMLFPGQGAQYPGMLSQLAAHFPEFFGTLQEADSIYAGCSDQAIGALAEKIYPRPAFDDDSKVSNIKELTATENAQPALGVVSLGAARIMERFGVAAEAVAGHSYGELTALCAAGVLSSADLFRLSRLRGELMAAGTGDRGSMVAVSAPLSTIEQFIDEHSLDLVLANRNTPTQGVLSGSTSEIDRAYQLLTQQGLSAKKLDVAAAFHSTLIADAAAPFADALKNTSFSDPQLTVFSNTTGNAYSKTADAVRSLLAEQLASPVNFVNEIESMYQAGIRTFVEVGPGGRLTGMVKAILGNQDYQTVTLDGSNGKRSAIADLGRALAKLAALGYPLDLSLWDGDFAATQNTSKKKKRGISVTLCGANSYKQPEKRPPLQIQAKEVATPVSQQNTSVSSQSVQAPAQPSSTASPVVNSGQNLHDALRITQQSLQALQSLQEQTAKLHQQFLEGQQSATQSFMTLVQQQQQLMQGGPVAAVVNAAPVQNHAQTVAAPVAPAVAVQSVSVAPVLAPEPVKIVVPVATTTALDSAPLLLEIIAEKTGYPVEMLELEMALDSDLGIDSIKRVEILSALQEKLPNAPVISPEDLGSLQTLGQIVDHLNSSTATTEVVAVQTSGVDKERVQKTLLDVIAEKTGYPVEMLELDMALDSDLGIDSIKRVEILSSLQEQLPEVPAVRPEDLGVLQTLGQIIDHLTETGQQRIPTLATALTASQPDKDKIASTLLEVIAEKTGYPVDMLELDMALDSDLGIDSIKRVEILSALQEKLPDVPAVRPEDLGVLQTLGQIIDHLSQGHQERIPTVPPTPQLGQLDKNKVATALLTVIADKTGYPVDMLELDMALDTDLGIDSIKRVEILSALQEQLPGAPAIKPEHLGTLQTVGQIVDFLATTSGSDSPATGVTVSAQAAPKTITRQVLKSLPLAQNRPEVDFNFQPGSEVWITDDGSALSDAICSEFTNRQLIPKKIAIDSVETLEVPDRLSGLVILSPLKGADDRFLKQAFQLVRKYGATLNRTAQQGGAFLTTLSRLNGSFGLGEGSTPISDVLSGGLAGLCKTAVLEWPSIHGKALDIAMGMEIASTSVSVVAEVFRRSPLEVGLTSRGFQALELETLKLDRSDLKLSIEEGDLVVISGGARGVTAEVAISLAARSQATLLLLGRSQLPADEPEWLSGLTTEADIKKAIVAQSQTPLKPLEVAKEFDRISAEREIRANLDRILNAGGTPIYRAVDLRNEKNVAAVIDDLRTQYGPVRGIIHGAGVLADKLIAEKTDEQFEQVYSTKVDGLRALLNATSDDALKFIALFSSSTGRFGRIGQVDYAVANEILNKTAQQQAATKPDCRVVSLNWGPWDGGMVTPALKKVFAQEGIEVIDLQRGAEYLIDEISSPQETAVELVILGGGEEETEEDQPESHQNIYISKAFDLDLSIDQYPFLKSHVMDGKAVLPMAVIIEWMAHGATHNNPGLKFQGFNDLRILKGVILEGDEKRELQIMTGKAMKSDGVHVVPVELSSYDTNGKMMVHARGRVVLATKLPEMKVAMDKLALTTYPHDDQLIYHSERLFHGKDFQGIREMIGCSREGVSALTKPAPQPQQWISQPLRNSWFADPLVLDSSFQLLILWSFEQYQSGSLPVFAERYRQYKDRFPDTGVEVRAQIVKQDAHRAVANIEFIDPLDGQLVARLENYECVIDASLNASFQRNKLIGVA
jgi:acyl transferase domain-containing protein/acyl carrier protein/NAD(P)-dependent dehydrogenase (short-subunit alcohol dehydrogenase family)